MPFRVFAFIVALACVNLLIKLAGYARQIEQLRYPDKPVSSNWNFIFTGGILSYRFAPIPFFSEHSDSDEIRDLIKKRNLWLIPFWGMVVCTVMAALTC